MELKGNSASLGIITAPVILIKSEEDIYKLSGSEIVVLPDARPTFIHAIIKAKGIISDIGGITCHLANIARELAIPCVMATEKALDVLKDGVIVTLDGNTGCVSWHSDDNIMSIKNPKKIEENKG